ncbi:MAG: rRNA maturation RNase YbeY [Bacteroidota bacterium]|nr:rRNA maturation RNase YbeY [Bacteroidota bacterium]
MRITERISFQIQDVDLVVKEKNKIRQWIVDAIKNEGKKTGDITYIFCSDEYLLKMNRQYLQHDDYTDVITFDYTEENRVSGDIFISYERIVDNANQLKTLPEEELHRVMIHGVMHLCGYKDKLPGEREQMTQKENQYLALLPNQKN